MFFFTFLVLTEMHLFVLQSFQLVIKSKTRLMSNFAAIFYFKAEQPEFASSDHPKRLMRRDVFSCNNKTAQSDLLLIMCSMKDQGSAP